MGRIRNKRALLGKHHRKAFGHGGHPVGEDLQLGRRITHVGIGNSRQITLRQNELRSR